MSSAGKMFEGQMKESARAFIALNELVQLQLMGVKDPMPRAMALADRRIRLIEDAEGVDATFSVDGDLQRKLENVWEGLQAQTPFLALRGEKFLEAFCEGRTNKEGTRIRW